MAFDRKHYREIKNYMMDRLMRPPCHYTGNNPIDWAVGFFDLISDCVAREDYEGAKATRDAIIEFLNSFGAEIPEDARLNLNLKKL